MAQNRIKPYQKQLDRFLQGKLYYTPDCNGWLKELWENGVSFGILSDIGLNISKEEALDYFQQFKQNRLEQLREIAPGASLASYLWFDPKGFHVRLHLVNTCYGKHPYEAEPRAVQSLEAVMDYFFQVQKAHEAWEAALPEPDEDDETIPIFPAPDLQDCPVFIEILQA